MRSHVTLLHCTTEYPAPLVDVNLRAMDTLAKYFGLPAGYSDHTPGITIPIAAAALGAVIVEKHFTLDRNLPEVTTRHVASVVFQYQPKVLAKERDRLENPFGFVVTAYRSDPEINTTPSGARP